MVTIRKKQIGEQTYYYLEHTVRKKENIEKKEQYLGKTIPTIFNGKPKISATNFPNLRELV